MSDASECPVPRCPSDLCFNSNEFTRESFSVDHFLQEHRNKANLERMRDDLGIYLKVLRSAMIDLINKDYTDFVNLSTNLIGLDKAIDSIQTPLGQLKEELLQVQQNLNEAIFEVSVLVETRKQLEERRLILKSASRVNISLSKLSNILSEGDSLAMLQRAASEYSQIKFHVSRCQNLLVSADKQKCELLGQKLMNIIDGRFISCLTGGYQQSLSSLLGIYLTLGRASEAEKLYRKEIVAPAMAKLINEEALASQPRGLQGLYDSVLSFINEEMKPLLILTSNINRSSPIIKGFQFLINSFWPEVEERLEMNLASIYAPGNPELFFQRYTESLEFLSKLEENCSSEDTLHLLKKHPNYTSFLQRWNLPVYFQIRFQEIAGELETVMSESDNELKKTPKDNNEGYQLLVTLSAWKCLQRCWADKVFIPQLTHRFWKLSLQVLARYYTWSGQFLVKRSGVTNSTEVDNLVSLYADIETLSKQLPEFFNSVCQLLESRFSTFPLIKDKLKGSLDESSTTLLSQLNGVSDKLVNTVITKSVTALRQVSEVPRLFRRTNRESPVKPLPYVSAVINPAVHFYETHKSHPHSMKWIRLIFSDITKNYYTCVCDVLTSVQKTEESLRRLKKIRDRGVNAGGAGERNTSGDDDKIRLQLYIDVNSYCKQIESLNIERHEINQLQSLLNVVQTTQPKPAEMK